MTETFSYDLSRSCDEIRPDYTFDVSCQGTVPQAMMAFLESSDFEGALRLAVSLGGDSDTLAGIFHLSSSFPMSKPLATTAPTP